MHKVNNVSLQGILCKCCDGRSDQTVLCFMKVHDSWFSTSAMHNCLTTKSNKISKLGENINPKENLFSCRTARFYFQRLKPRKSLAELIWKWYSICKQWKKNKTELDLLPAVQLFSSEWTMLVSFIYFWQIVWWYLKLVLQFMQENLYLIKVGLTRYDSTAPG